MTPRERLRNDIRLAINHLATVVVDRKYDMATHEKIVAARLALDDLIDKAVLSEPEPQPDGAATNDQEERLVGMFRMFLRRLAQHEESNRSMRAELESLREECEKLRAAQVRTSKITSMIEPIGGKP